MTWTIKATMPPSTSGQERMERRRFVAAVQAFRALPNSIVVSLVNENEDAEVLEVKIETDDIAESIQILVVIADFDAARLCRDFRDRSP